MVKNDEEPYVRGEALVLLNRIGNQNDVNDLAASVLLSNSDSAPRAVFFFKSLKAEITI